MKIQRNEILTFQEVLTWLKKRRGESKWWATSDQREIASYVEQHKKLNKEMSQKLLKKLTDDIGIPKDIAIQIVNILPLTIDEVSPLIDQLQKEEDLSKDEIEAKTKEILQATRKVWKERTGS